MSDSERQSFEMDFRNWLHSVAKDAARSLADMPMTERELAAKNYKQLLDQSQYFTSSPIRNA